MRQIIYGNDRKRGEGKNAKAVKVTGGNSPKGEKGSPGNRCEAVSIESRDCENRSQAFHPDIERHGVV